MGLGRLYEKLEYLARSSVASLAFMGAALATPDGVQSYGDTLEEKLYHERQLPSIVDKFESYKNNHLPVLLTYLKKENLESKPVIAVGSAELPSQAVGGINVQDKYSILLGNKDFEKRIKYGLCEALGLSYEQGLRFYHDHEHIHSAGITEELDVYLHQRKMYTWAAKNSDGHEKSQYLKLARAADQRVEEYGGQSNLDDLLD